MDKIFENSRLKYLLKKFENNKNRGNYYKLCKYINKKVRKIRKKIKKYNTLLTDEAGVLIYNSRRKCENTWENYNSGNIKYNNKHEVNLINKSEKLGSSSIYKLNKCGLQTYYLSVKLGSNSLQEFEEYGLPIIGLFFLFLFFYDPEADMKEVEEFVETAKNNNLIEENGTLIAEYTSGGSMVFNGNIDSEDIGIIEQNLELDISIYSKITYKSRYARNSKSFEVNEENKEKILNFLKDSIAINF